MAITIENFGLSEWHVKEGVTDVYAFRFGGALCHTKCNNEAEVIQKLTSGEWKLSHKEGKNSLWCGPIQSVNIDVLKPFLVKRKTLNDQMATVFPQDVKAAAAF